MSCHNYVVITCSDFYERHRRIFRQHSKYLDRHFNFPHFLLQHDIADSLPHASREYQPYLWQKHLRHSLPLHVLNITTQDQNDRLCRDQLFLDRYAHILSNIQTQKLFEARPLSLAEHSLLHKHYCALHLCIENQRPLLIIEDDAYLDQDASLDKLVADAFSTTSSAGFYNLVANFTSTPKNANLPLFRFHSKARTNTTCAYVVFPELAIILVESFFPYSLPVDFHYQYLFFKLGLAGFSANHPIFINGSSEGLEKSSVQ